MEQVMILGLGNILLGDEGVGVRVVETILRDYEIPENVQVEDGGTAGIDLLPCVNKGEILIIVDAARTDKGPASTIRLVGAEVPAFLSAKLSPHQIGLPDLLATAELLDRVPKRLVLIGVQPKSIETGVELSQEMHDVIPTLIDMIQRELVESGVPALQRKVSA